MQCSNCGTIVNDSSCSCPKCKRKLYKCSMCKKKDADLFNSKLGWVCRDCFNTERGLNPDQFKCPVCSCVQVVGQQKCSNCEVEFSKIKINCPACDEKIPFGDRCTNCGVILNKIKQVAKQANLNQLNYNSNWGYLNSEIICPHCQTKGYVYTQTVNRKKGISGTKATAALLTGGISILAAGLSRKEEFTQAHCDNCHETWDF